MVKERLVEGDNTCNMLRCFSLAEWSKLQYVYQFVKEIILVAFFGIIFLVRIIVAYRKWGNRRCITQEEQKKEIQGKVRVQTNIDEDGDEKDEEEKTKEDETLKPLSLENNDQ